MAPPRPTGYLPQDRPPLPALVSLGFQHVLTMFPATALVALFTGFDLGATLFASGLATLVAVAGSRGRIPLYYGGSFSYIAPVSAVAAAPWGGLRVAQVGIVATGLVNVLVGLAIRRLGRERLSAWLPPAVTGPVALVIGVTLAKPALDMASGHWGLALLTLLATVLFSVYLRGRGLLGMLPVLLGAALGYAASLAAGRVDLRPVLEAPWWALPRFQLPDFAAPGAWQAALAIAPIAVATIPESTAHLYQLGLYVDRLADELGRPRPGIARLLGLNLVLDGCGDVICGLLGAPAATNYGENNSLMAITRNYSAAAMAAAGVIAMLLAFCSKLAALVGTLPAFVTGGLAIYLFGVIALQGIALMQAEGVDLFDPRQLAVGAVILVLGVGGAAMEGGAIPVGELRLPAVATAALAGIALNALFRLAEGRRPGAAAPAAGERA